MQQWDIPQLHCASVSKRVFVRHHLYENVYRLQVHFHTNQTHFHTHCRRTRFQTEAQGNLELNTRGKFLKKLRCFVGVKYNKINWFYQLGWYCELATVKRFESWDEGLALETSLENGPLWRYIVVPLCNMRPGSPLCMWTWQHFIDFFRKNGVWRLFTQRSELCIVLKAKHCKNNRKTFTLHFEERRPE